MSPRYVSLDLQSFHLSRDTLSHAWSLSPLRLVPHDQQRKGRPVRCRRLLCTLVCALHVPALQKHHKEVEYLQNMGCIKKFCPACKLLQWPTQFYCRNTALQYGCCNDHTIIKDWKKSQAGTIDLISTHTYNIVCSIGCHLLSFCNNVLTTLSLKSARFQQSPQNNAAMRE